MTDYVALVISQLMKTRYSKNIETIRSVNTDLQNALQQLETQSTPGQLPGTNTNDNAAAGNVGEYINDYRTYYHTLSLTSTDYAEIATISLTPGDWDINGAVSVYGNGSTTAFDYMGVAISTSNTAFDGLPNYGPVSYAEGGKTGLPKGVTNICPTSRVSLATPKTLYLLAKPVFSAGTLKGFGKLRARRVR